jgi:DinB family protein
VARSRPAAGSSPSILFTSALRSIFERDLRVLRREVEAYPDEQLLWQPVPGITNTGGTLVLHLAGNLQHFLGARLGRTGYVRQRDAEFARRGVPRAVLLSEIDAASQAIAAGFAGVTDARLSHEFPEVIGGMRFTTGDYLTHLATHLAYHLGQVDYHRRTVTGSDHAVGAMRTTELSSATSDEGAEAVSRRPVVE